MKLKSICGVIITSSNPEKLADFYGQVFGVEFEKEIHGDLDEHYGVDIGEVHLGIHPIQNMGKKAVGNSSISIAYNVSSIEETIQKLVTLKSEQVTLPHDEGFGVVASYKDPEGNLFEIVELNYNFSKRQ